MSLTGYDSAPKTVAEAESYGLTARTRREPGAGQRIAFGLFSISLGLLTFLAGAAVILAKVPPYEILRDAYLAATALHDKLTRYNDVYQTDLWREARTQARGVTLYDPAKALPGYTLYTSGHGASAHLVAMDGKPAHEWRLPFSKVWDESAAVKSPAPDSHVYMRKAQVLPNGDLLAIYIGTGDTPWGYGLVKMTKDSQLIWKYLAHVHHDFAVAPDGRIYTLTHEVSQDKLAKHPHLEPPRIEDFLVVLSPDGEELQRVSLLDAMISSPFARLLDALPAYAHSDPLHANAVDWIDAEMAKNARFVSEGQVLLSFRGPGLLAVLDLERGQVVWAARGPWLEQHDPDILPNGNVLVFDNQGNFSASGMSRILEFDPKTMQVLWSYAGTPEHPFESRLRAAQERLPNGNTLITESDGGRLFEVTRSGEIVWEYVNPVRGGEGSAYVPVVSWGQRIRPNDLDAGFRNSLPSHD